MMRRLPPYAAAGAALALSGCSGWLAPDIAEFESGVLAAHPVGTPVAALAEDRALGGYDWGGPAVTKSAPGFDADQRCLRRTVTYGFWAGGTRFVCVIPEGDRIGRINVFEQVAGL